MNETPRDETRPLVISLTSIPPRFPYLGETLSSLLEQRAEVVVGPGGERGAL